MPTPLFVQATINLQPTEDELAHGIRGPRDGERFWVDADEEQIQAWLRERFLVAVDEPKGEPEL
jgi:hypothetical protein